MSAGGDGSLPFRLPDGGRIDRSRSLAFRFDGRTFAGHPGDTLASALLANGVRLVARSFKYHRPRGIFSAGIEEPNALVAVGTGDRHEPNVPAPRVELYDGLVAASQNRWPSLRFDLMALAGLAGPFLPAGFYYKTFQGPRWLWKRLYEPVIRRAAGLGRAPVERDPDRYETAHAHCDVLVVGAGPAGLMAALAAARTGARVILADDQPEPGGWLLSEPVHVDGQPAAAWAATLHAALVALPNVRLFRRTLVYGFYDHTVLAALEDVGAATSEPPPFEARQRHWTLRARQVVLATGAHERPLPCADNDRPGVMLASAVQAYAVRYGVATGRRLVLATNNDGTYGTALALKDAGLSVTALVDSRPAPDRPGLADELRKAGIGVLIDRQPVRVHGRRAVEGIEIARADGTERTRLTCDGVGVSGGWSPLVHLASQSGARPVWDDARGAFVPGQPVQAERSVGAARGLFALSACLADGAAGGRAAAEATGFAASGLPAVPETTDPPSAARSGLAVLPAAARARKVFIDLHNDVTAADLQLAVREGYRSVEHAKRYTTLGMGSDQGKTGSVNGYGILAESRREPVAAVGTTTFRPPFAPVTLGAVVGPARGRHFQPERRSAMHRWHERYGALFVELGQWLRPRAYPRPGEALEEAIKREALAVRQAVGLCDVSMLGKIDIQGPDAATFVNRLYVNGFAKLAVGRVRYGLMLREDGLVFDDGTTAHLDEDHFHMTTTSAKAAKVLAHMEFYAQTVWPELDVQLCSVTEQWAAMALAGPHARAVLAAVVDPGTDVGADALPFMGWIAARIGGVPARVFRISFSGELGYEINVPWGYGEAVWERVLDAGAAFGIVPYGSEALAVLRIEKGHVAGPELDGRTSAADLGLGRMVSAKKAFIGQKLAERPGLRDPARPSLVGLRPVDRRDRLRGGAHLTEAAGGGGSQERTIGVVTSVADSPSLGHWIALGFIEGGLTLKGTVVDAVFPLKGEHVPVEVVDPVFVDPEGTRVRA